MSEQDEEECEFGGDISEDCKDCVDGVDYHYDKKTGECVKREKECRNP